MTKQRVLVTSNVTTPRLKGSWILHLSLHVCETGNETKRVAHVKHTLPQKPTINAYLTRAKPNVCIQSLCLVFPVFFYEVVFLYFCILFLIIPVLLRVITVIFNSCTLFRGSVWVAVPSQLIQSPVVGLSLLQYLSIINSASVNSCVCSILTQLLGNLRRCTSSLCLCRPDAKWGQTGIYLGG